MAFIYKQISPSEIDTLKSLLKVFGEAFEDTSTYQNNIPNDSYLKNLLSKENFIALVATADTEVVGGLVAYELEKFEQERKEIYIYDLAVSANYRRQGVATSLINKLKEIAKERKAYVIYVQADHGDEPAIKLYESLGTKEDVYHFDIGIE